MKRLLALLLFSVIATAHAADPVAVLALFEKHCSECHSDGDEIPPLNGGINLDNFLKDEIALLTDWVTPRSGAPLAAERTAAEKANTEAPATGTAAGRTPLLERTFIPFRGEVKAIAAGIAKVDTALQPTTRYVTLTNLYNLRDAKGEVAESDGQLDIYRAAAEATLGAKPKRFTYRGPASPVKKRSYTRNARGLDVEIIEREDGRQEERPHVAVPILFVKGRAELLDATSQANLTELGAILRRLTTAEPKARFTIQGHNSAEGDRALNVQLSQQRAARIQQMLVAGVPAAVLGQIGFGPDWATAPASAAEADLQKDRRVLVVRE